MLARGMDGGIGAGGGGGGGGGQRRPSKRGKPWAGHGHGCSLAASVGFVADGHWR